MTPFGTLAELSDPFLAAFAEVKRVRADMKPIEERHTDAEYLMQEQVPGVEVDGVTLRSQSDIERHFSVVLSRYDLDDAISRLQAARDKVPSDDTAAAARKAARQDALDALAAQDSAARAAVGFDAIEKAWNAAVDTEAAAIEAAIATAPTTPAGAIALLDFIAAELESGDQSLFDLPAAIRNVAAFLKAGA